MKTKDRTNIRVFLSDIVDEPEVTFSDIDLLGTPETSFRGRRTLIARRVRRSTLSSCFPWAEVMGATTAAASSTVGLKMVMYLMLLWLLLMLDKQRKVGFSGGKKESKRNNDT